MKIAQGSLFVILLCFGSIQLLGKSVSAFETAMKDLPSYQLEILTKVWLHDHPGFPSSAVRLGDINGDGYDDIAFTSVVDTVFIFFGGDPMDGELDGFVLGGSNGAVAADFNDDGIIDLATGASYPNNLGEPDPMRYGKIRVYFGSRSFPYFGPEPDVVLQGSRQYDDFGIHLIDDWNYNGLLTLDLNGDGKKDLMFRRRDWRDGKDWELAVIFSGKGFDTTVQAVIQKPDTGGFGQNYGGQVLIGDINGDNHDDVIVSYNNGRSEHLIYLGQSQGYYSESNLRFVKDANFYPWPNRSDIVDANGDGFDDVISSQPIVFTGFHLFLGSSDITNLAATDSIENPKPDPIHTPKRVFHVGDMNGDGRDDFILGWTTILFERGLVYMVYPAGPFEDWEQPVGYCGILPDETGLKEGAYDVGDVNGDGYDDIAILGRPGSTTQESTWYSRFWIIGGSPKLQTGIPEQVRPSNLNIEVYPNPANTSEEQINVRIPADLHAPLTISISNLLGQRIIERRVESETELPIITLNPGALLAGVYQIVVATIDTHIVEYFVNQ